MALAMRRRTGIAWLLGALLLLGYTGPAMAVDIGSLWDFGKPEISEQRFVAAMKNASMPHADGGCAP